MLTYTVFGIPLEYLTQGAQPNLFLFAFRYLYKDNLLPKPSFIVGYARSALTVSQLRAKVEPFMKVSFMLFTVTMKNVSLKSFLIWKRFHYNQIIFTLFRLRMKRKQRQKNFSKSVHMLRDPIMRSLDILH